jgi:hypothetical protein
MRVKPLDERVSQFRDAELEISRRYRSLRPMLDERRARLFGAAEAQVIGRGGIAVVGRATGMSRARIAAGLRELEQLHASGDSATPALPRERVRRSGGGRKRLTEVAPTLLRDLDSLVDPESRGDPESPLRWTAKSLRSLATELAAMGHRISATKVGQLLHELGYSLQANTKTLEGKQQHPDRDAQFRHIHREAKAFLGRGSPVISVDTKKKELVGQLKNGGQEWRPKGQPEEVATHDFPDPSVRKAIPYGVYDTNRNEAWVSVGTDHNTAEFAVATIRRWWRMMGCKVYPSARELLITADAGGSNGYRSSMWKAELQRFADESNLAITVCHFPPGTSKWNKIEHKLFSAISQNWRGRPLVSHETIVNLIASTTTKTGLQVRARIDRRRYPNGKTVSAAEMQMLAIHRNRFHGEWNYMIKPRPM